MIYFHFSERDKYSDESQELLFVESFNHFFFQIFLSACGPWLSPKLIYNTELAGKLLKKNHWNV